MCVTLFLTGEEQIGSFPANKTLNYFTLLLFLYYHFNKLKVYIFITLRQRGLWGLLPTHTE